MLLIKNGLLYTMEEEHPIRADILLKDGKIERIAPQIQREESMEILDAAGCKVFPGFIDAHSHIGISEEKKTVQMDSTNEGTNPITPCMRAIDAINPMDSAFHNALAVGITGVMAGPGSANPVGGYPKRAVAEEGSVASAVADGITNKSLVFAEHFGNAK